MYINFLRQLYKQWVERNIRCVNNHQHYCPSPALGDTVAMTVQSLATDPEQTINFPPHLSLISGDEFVLNSYMVTLREELTRSTHGQT